jgi:hypothetical protein
MVAQAVVGRMTQVLATHGLAALAQAVKAQAVALVTPRQMKAVGVAVLVQVVLMETLVVREVMDFNLL